MAKWVAITLGILLIATNGAWLYGAIDLAVTEKYRQQIEYENKQSLQAYEVLASYFLVGMHRTEVLNIVRKRFPEIEPFEKKDCLIAGWVMLPVGQDGRVKQGQCAH